MKDVTTALRDLAETRAALKIEAELQPYVERGAFRLEVKLAADRTVFNHQGQSVWHERLCQKLEAVIRLEMRNHLDRAGDLLRVDERAFAEQLLVAAAKTAGASL